MKVSNNFKHGVNEETKKRYVTEDLTDSNSNSDKSKLFKIYLIYSFFHFYHIQKV